jgi:hypothetical protein
MRTVVGFIRRLLSVVRVARLLSEDGTQAERKWARQAASGTSERILGAIARDGKSGILINARGNQQQFTVLDGNTIEGCYASGGPKYLSAACTIWTRQP